MPLKASDPATEWVEIDRFEAADGRTGGVGWIAHPDETMGRASHALVADGEVWVLDPLDVTGLDDFLGELGTVAGVVVLLDRHKRDAGTIAQRHDVPVYLPEPLRDVATDVNAPVEHFAGELGDTGYRTHTVVDNFVWTEVTLYDPERGVLVVPEALGTTEYFLADGERLGVHPALRLKPPRTLGRFEPERILVGHGAGVHEDASGALRNALTGARGRTPGLYLKNLKTFLPD